MNILFSLLRNYLPPKGRRPYAFAQGLKDKKTNGSEILHDLLF